VYQFKRGRRRYFGGAVIISIWLETVVKKNVLVVLSVTVGEWANKGQAEKAQNPRRYTPGLLPIG
jgi:hypothetical protein